MVKDNKKEYTHQTFKFRTDLANRLSQYRDETGVSKTFAVEKAVEEYLNKVFPVKKK